MIKGPISILAECAAQDMSIDTEGALQESTIRSAYSNIPEADVESRYTAEMVTVQQIGNDYLVEAYSIVPFMKDFDVKSFAEALDYVAEANNMPPKSIGLLVESQECVTSTIDCAIAAAKESCKPSIKKNALSKVGKVEKLVDSLTKKGYKVKKKKSGNKK